MEIEVILDVEGEYYNKAEYVVRNLLFPYSDKFVITDKYNANSLINKKIIYCSENSSYLNKDISSNNLYVVLENSTVNYYSYPASYNEKDIVYINKMPCLFPVRSKSIAQVQKNIMAFDVFAASFFFLACWQEYTIKDRDSKGRIPLKYTIQNKLNIIRVPIVNEYLIILEKYISDLWGVQLKYKMLPGQRSCFVALSHDIDHIDYSFVRYVRHLKSNRRIIEKNMSNLFNTATNIFKKKNVFKELANIELRLNVASTNFFFSEYERKYRSYADSLVRYFNEIGFEVGHHISDKCILDGSLDEDTANFNYNVKNITGERVHTLRFETHKLFTQIEGYSYCYDNSLLFAEDLGYRTGFTYPHYIYDPINERPFKVLAIPLNVMDTTLVDRKYLYLDDDIAEKVLVNFIRSFIQYGGVLSVLFHQGFFWLNTDKRLKMYERLLQLFKEQDVKVGTCRDVYLWYRKMCDPQKST